MPDNSACLKKDTEILINGILKNIPNVEAIILYGGYGRGEGAWIENSGVVSAYNDYDLLVISSSNISKFELSELRKSLASIIGISWVDISILKKEKLKKLKSSIFNFDLKYGSTVLYGDNSILDNIPDLKANDITLQEVRILFFTRLFTLIGSFDDNALSMGIESGDKARFFNNQMGKALLACVDCLLIQKGLYHTSYIERVNRVCSNDFNIANDHKKLIRWALEQKLNPSNLKISKVQFITLYSKVLNFYISTMSEGLSQYYRCDVSEPAHLFKQYLREPSVVLRRVYYLLRNNKSLEKTLKVERLQLLLIHANPLYDGFSLKKSNDFSSEIDVKIDCQPEQIFETMRNEIAELRLSL